jgi:hypothetical protein
MRVAGWFRLLFAALLVALSGSALAGPHYFCRMAGRVMADCCCSAEDHQGSEPSVSPKDCCERIEAKALPDVGRALQSTDDVPSGALSAVVAVPRYVAPSTRTERLPMQSSRGPPGLERLFLVHCAFLI